MSTAGERDYVLSTFQEKLDSSTKWMNLQTKPSGSSGGEAGFSVTLQCKVAKSLIADGRRVEFLYEGDGDNSTFVANQAADIPTDHEGVRGVLRSLLLTVTPLQGLYLTNEQWEDILPKPAVSPVAAHACKACQDGYLAHAMIRLAVNHKIRFNASKALLMICTELAVAGVQEYCSICLEALEASIVEVPYSGHAFCDRTAQFI